MGIEIYQLMVGYNDNLNHESRKEVKHEEVRKEGYFVNLSDDSLSFLEVGDDRKDLFEVFETTFACGMKVFYANGILSNVQVVNRAICHMTGLPEEKIRSGNLTKEEWESVDKAVKKLYEWPLYIAYDPVGKEKYYSVVNCLNGFNKVYDEKEKWLLVIDCDADITALGRAWNSLKQLHCPIIIANVADKK